MTIESAKAKIRVIIEKRGFEEQAMRKDLFINNTDAGKVGVDLAGEKPIVGVFINNNPFEKKFTIQPLKDMPIGDNSLHYRMSSSDGGHVDFGVLDGELCAYTWMCPKEGRAFLKTLETYSNKRKLKLTIPTVLNGALEKILRDNGYTMKEVPYMDDVCELWSKDA